MISEIEKIKNADRSPVHDVKKVCEELNFLAKQNQHLERSMHWTISSDAVGPCLQAQIEFKRPFDCLKFVEDIYDLQEKADHHSNLTMHNFHKVILQLSTHHPVPAITSVDVAFAYFVTN